MKRHHLSDGASANTARTNGYDLIARYDPRTAAWLSAIFPGFGHLLINHNVRGVFFTLSEVFVNTFAHVNESMVYTFCGQFERAAEELNPNWAIGYAVIYLFSMMDSYRLAIDQNRLIDRGVRGINRIAPAYVRSQEFIYSNEKNPWVGVAFSCLLPGLGQFYVQRYWLAIYGVFWSWVYGTLSGFNTALIRLLLGDMEGAARLDPHWLLFMPSLVGGAAHHTFVCCLRQNRLFRTEQRLYLCREYQRANIRLARYRGQ
ncbi:hypothetical protein [Cohnella panacarvi]|uniref:hypothetical protein n=1 Tax=Cohnella panacarvi TaxID=400776 RepID=UPI0004BB5923|nr:hypothetical protein [Cohnella panacarvi]